MFDKAEFLRNLCKQTLLCIAATLKQKMLDISLINETITDIQLKLRVSYPVKNRIKGTVSKIDRSNRKELFFLLAK